MTIERNDMGEIEISLDEGESFSHKSLHFKSDGKEDKLESIRIHNVESLRIDRGLEEESLPQDYTEYKFKQ